ncbi:peptidylprolyl isomerase [Virgibacillus alimentarius]|uniref:peptidylprolyl isomerase n=1 Tax=Virgibacillus alimentarius TaxID=698769 RepID=UPI0004931A37|nr:MULTISPECIES: peptidyl-prolyl cis-trans isomerase [Virgibacillus]HLR66642.1 peptidyl-prolyl cis-trans isomerase [Virgibacillus sp.]
MSRRLLLGIVVVLLITNIATFLIWKTDEKIVIDTGGEEKEINSNKPVAIIDGAKISYDDWVSSLRRDYGEKHLKTLIDQKLVKQLAEQENIHVHEKVIDREIALLTTMQGIMTKEETARMEEKWRESILHRYQLEALLTEGIDISAGEIQKYYEQYHKQYDFQASRQYSHIVVEDKKTVEKIMDELDQGASFRLLAKEYSIDGDTKKEGGYLGFFTNKSSFVPSKYNEKAAKMEERTYSKPFKTTDGFVILYLHRNLPSITFSYDEIKPYIKRELALDKLDQPLTASPLWKKADINWIFEE